MSPVADQERLRREYLRKTRKAGILGAAATVLSGISLIVICDATFNIVGQLQDMIVLLGDNPKHLIEEEGIGGVLWDGLLFAIGLLILVAFAATPAALAWLFWKKGGIAKRDARLAYVPPVTPDTLPIDEILVRGSEIPHTVQSEVLLRAAKSGATPKEEWLRISQEPLK